MHSLGSHKFKVSSRRQARHFTLCKYLHSVKCLAYLLETLNLWLSKKCVGKTPIKLLRSAGLSESSVGPCLKVYFLMLHPI